MIIKCKMCGGDLNIQDGNPICECDFCGTMQTVPQADNEKKTNLFNRANRLRMGAEFDRAATVYASITAEFPEEAEAYWGLCLCKYGIEYVDDPLTGKKLPTCHRTMSESIMDDSDFIQACENADAEARRIYREEAKAIDRLQQDILSIVANEAPYDVFICYKETDNDGQRTEDSVLAQDIYDTLSGKGLKVFFARISLEDKLGQQYEPYIYAALHSSKVMLAIGTSYDYFDAVWVKNEWARFLDMMRTDKTKALIPCYKGIDAYDMPREFKNLQAQDMGKLGWLQDLARGVLKLCGKDELQQKTIVGQTSPTSESLLRRAMVFLEDKQWEEARQYADRVLDLDVENGQAYLIKLMADLKVTREKDIQTLGMLIQDNMNYKKIIRFGDDDLKSRIEGYAISIQNKRETLNRRMLEAKAKYELAQKAYEERQQEIAGGKDLLAIQIRLSHIRKTISEYQMQKAKLVGLFDGKKRNELDNMINSLQHELSTLEQEEKQEKEKLRTSAEEILPPDIDEYHYELASAYYEAKMYEEAYKQYDEIRGYADVDDRIRELAGLIPNVSLEPGIKVIIRRLSECIRANDMIQKLNEMNISHNGASYTKIMEVLQKRSDFERLYGTNHNDTMAALKKLL